MITCAQKGCGEEATSRGFCESDYRRRVRMRIFGYRDAEPLRGHVAELRRLGWTWEAIGQTAGLATQTARQIHLGNTCDVWPETVDRLLSVPLVPYYSHHGVDSTGTRRRVQALAWLGWPAREVAARAGTTERSLHTLIRPDRRPSAALAARVAAVYEELCMTPGPSRITASKARGSGHAPPLAWDDVDIEDPKARPRGAARSDAA